MSRTHILRPKVSSPMHALTDSEIRSSFVNASVRERKALTLPTNFDDLDWDRLDFLGWRDPKLPQVAYIVIPVDDRNVGIMLRLGGRKPRNRQLCSFCEDVQLPHEVVFYSARRAGSAGRNGNTVGTLLCGEFQCNANVRAMPSKIMAGGHPEEVRAQRMENLRARVTAFARRFAAA